MHRRGFLTVLSIFLGCAGCLDSSSSLQTTRETDQSTAETDTGTRTVPDCSGPIEGVIRIDNRDDTGHTVELTVRSTDSEYPAFERTLTLDPEEGEKPGAILEDVVTEPGEYELTVALRDVREVTTEWVVEDDCDDAWVVIDSDGIEVKPLLHD